MTAGASPEEALALLGKGSRLLHKLDRSSQVLQAAAELGIKLPASPAK